MYPCAAEVKASVEKSIVDYAHIWVKPRTPSKGLVVPTSVVTKRRPFGVSEMKNSYVSTVSVLGWWIAGKLVNPKTGKPKFFLNVVRKIVIKSESKSALYPALMHITLVKKDQRFNVKGIVEKDIPWWNRDTSKPCPTKEVKVDSISSADKLVEWLAYYLVGGHMEADKIVRKMMNDEPVIMNGKEKEDAEAA